jgi:large subunit ribosomal protein L26e
MKLHYKIPILNEYLIGSYKGNKGKVTVVYRKRWCVYIEKLGKTRANGAPVNIPIKPSQCTITKLKLDKDRNDLLKRKAQAVSQKGKGEKHTAEGTRKVE